MRLPSPEQRVNSPVDSPFPSASLPVFPPSPLNLASDGTPLTYIKANTDELQVPLVTDLTHESQSTISRSNVYKAGKLDSTEDVDYLINAFKTPEGFEK